MSRSAKQRWRTVLASLVLAAPLLLMSGVSAQVGGVGADVQPQFPDMVTAGETFPAGLMFQNQSTDPVTLTASNITLVPACGSTAPGCAGAVESGVFQLSPTGLGRAGTACAGVPFAIVETSPGTFTFTAVGPSVVLAPGQGCVIDYEVTTTRVPTLDVSPAPGQQTIQLANVTFTPTDPFLPAFTVPGVDTTSVLQAAPQIVTQAAPQVIDVGQSFSDTAVVTGVANVPPPTGTVIFRVFGPTAPPNFPTICNPGTEIFTSPPVPLQPTGPTSSTAVSPPITLLDNPATPQDDRVGNFVVVATYSGDPNFTSVTSQCIDAAEQVTINPLPTITIVKDATPPSLPEPGGTFTFNVLVTNTSAEPLTITSLTDTINGTTVDLNGRGTCATGAVLAPGGTYSCSFPGAFTGLVTGPVLPSQTDTATVIGTDADGNTATDSDDAVVTITPAPPTIVVEKTADPLSLPEPGGAFTFDVVVTNTTPRSVTITTLTDNVYGNLNLANPDPRVTGNTCAGSVGIVLAPDPDGAAGPLPGGSFQCSFVGTFTSNTAGQTQTDIVRAVAVDVLGAAAEDTDDAVVTVTDVLPTILVEKTANPLSLPEPGGAFTYTVTVTNTSIEPVTVTSLTDNVYGNLNLANPGPRVSNNTCAGRVGTVLNPDPDGAGPGLPGSFTCTFSGTFTSNVAGQTETDIVRAVAQDSEGNPAEDTDDAVVTVTDALPIIRVDKTVDPATRLEPGGAFTFTVVVTNLSAEPVTVTSLVDNVYGNLNLANPGPRVSNNTCAGRVGTILNPDPDGAGPGVPGSFTCTFVGNFTGSAGAQEVDIVTANAVDSEGNQATDTDDATVSITNVVPTIVVDKTATPESLPEPGGTFTFNVVVTNTSIIPLTITQLTDNIYTTPPISQRGTCTTAIGTVLPASGGTYRCSFTGAYFGDAGDSQTDVVTAVAVDAGGESATDSDDAVVTITDVRPGISVVKTASPLSMPEPGGTFTFDVIVTNTGPVDLILTALVDDVYGVISGQGTCTTAVGTRLAPNATYRCSFPGDFDGDGGDTQTDVVTVTGVDQDGNTVDADDDATVVLTDVAPTVEVVKTATPESRPAPGGDFTFNVVVTNTSTETVSITTLTDDIYGNLATQGTCTTAIGTVLAPAATYSCSFTGRFDAAAGGRQTDVVTVVVTDDDNTPATDTDDATVTVTPPPPPPPPVGVLPNVITNTVTPTNAANPIAVRPTAAPTTTTTTTTTTTLAKTGAGVTDLVALGVGLLVTGGLLLLAASRWAPPGRRRAGDGWSTAA